MRCNECGGAMESTGWRKTSYPPKDEYKCVECGKHVDIVSGV